MKLKKINAALGLLSIVALLLHLGYTVFAYITFYYNPTIKLCCAICRALGVTLNDLFWEEEDDEQGKE